MKNKFFRSGLTALLGALALNGLGIATANAAATLVILNADGAGEGFNDPTPAAPVGGNPGTTLGQQRLIAFQYAANIWGATLTSTQTITIQANFDPLTCTATSAVLGSAGARFITRDFTGALKTGTWYGEALANKLSGVDQIPGEADIAARFNANLGNAGCLTGSPFYLGLDNNHGPLIDLVTVLLHEFGHGLGFQTFTSGSSGAFVSGFPSIWDHYLKDQTLNMRWVDIPTNAQRAASALNNGKLVWTGAGVTAALPGVLSLGVPQLAVSGPAAGTATGTYALGTASFGPALTPGGVSGDIMPVSSDSVNGDGCVAFNASNTLAVKGNIALINRGVCGFTIKVKNAQNAGAIGVIIADNVAGAPPPGLGGTDPTISIPAGRVTLADATKIRASLTTRSRTKSGVIGTLNVNTSQYAGADASGFALLYAPNPFQSGSSVSHYDVSATPNQLMEPAINGDLVHAVVVPYDLTFELLKDIGW